MSKIKYVFLFLVVNYQITSPGLGGAKGKTLTDWNNVSFFALNVPGKRTVKAMYIIVHISMDCGSSSSGPKFRLG